LLIDALALRDDDGGMTEPVGLLDRLGDIETKTYPVLLRDGDADTLIVLVSETATDGEALNEQDLNNGLQERVTLTVGGLLLDALMLGEDDGGSPELLRLAERDDDTLFDA